MVLVSLRKEINDGDILSNSILLKSLSLALCWVVVNFVLC